MDRLMPVHRSDYSVPGPPFTRWWTGGPAFGSRSMDHPWTGMDRWTDCEPTGVPGGSGTAVGRQSDVRS